MEEEAGEEVEEGKEGEEEKEEEKIKEKEETWNNIINRQNAVVDRNM